MKWVYHKELQKNMNKDNLTSKMHKQIVKLHLKQLWI